jgi:hypothetical protein
MTRTHYQSLIASVSFAGAAVLFTVVVMALYARPSLDHRPEHVVPTPTVTVTVTPMPPPDSERQHERSLAEQAGIRTRMLVEGLLATVEDFRKGYLHAH